VPPWEVMVEENQRNRLRPTIKWNDTVMPNEDMRHLTYLPGSDGRGLGPLQLAGVAVSITVEAEHWAANFFSGAMPSIIGTTEQEMTEDELSALDAQWSEKPNNLPRWLTQGLTLSEPPYNAEKSQLTETRQHEVGNTARMFNMPGALIEYQMSGASLRYTNDETIWADFQRRCLSPHYLEPIEQEISDLLTRSTVTRFNLDQLLRASIQTRAEVYDKLVPIGVMTVEEARAKEGLSAGSADFQPVPQSQPQAVPLRLAFERSLQDVHCGKCGRLVGRAAGAFETRCKRCGEMVRAA
jgi:HK97 family phage portal protein